MHLIESCLELLYVAPIPHADVTVWLLSLGKRVRQGSVVRSAAAGSRLLLNGLMQLPSSPLPQAVCRAETGSLTCDERKVNVKW